MLSEQGKPAFDPSASFRPSDYSPTLLQQQQQQQTHFATGHQQPPKQPGPAQQHLPRAARPASEIIQQTHHHPFLANSTFQSPEAEAIDKWFEDLSNYEQTLEEMAVVSLDTVFKDELSTIESWFRVLSEAERTAALYSLLQHSSQVQIRFFLTVLQQMAKKDPVGALLSPSADKGKSIIQLQGAMAKAEMEASQRLLSVLPIQPPAPLDRPPALRRLYDRHSVTIGESDEYSRLFRRDKRNSIDFLGRTVANSTSSTSGSNNGTTNSGNSNKFSTSLNGSGNSALNGGTSSGGNVNGVIGSGALSESISARVSPFGKPSSTPSQQGSSLNRISPPNTFGNRPKSVHEGDASSMFAANWNFASLGGNPLSTSSGLTSGSPGNIGDRTSYGRPKSVGGAEWLLSGASANHRASITEGLIDKSWSPLVSPNMGFHNGTNGSGQNLNPGGFPSSGLAVERPKSVAEGEFSQLHMSQWGSNSSNNSNSSNGSNSNRTSTLDELKSNNRRRTMLRPSAIISNVPVTVMEGDEKLLSASANTSSINIVSTMFNETPPSGSGSGSGSMSELTTGSGAETGVPTSSSSSAATASQGNASVFSYGGAVTSQPTTTPPPLSSSSSSSLSSYSQQQQQAVQQLQNLTLDLSASFRPSQPQPQQPRSRASSPFGSPLPSPIKAGFRSRPVSGPTSPRLGAQHGPPVSAWGAGPGLNNANGDNNSSNNNGSNGTNNGLNHHHHHHHHHYHLGGLDGSAIVPTDYNQKRHLSPPHQQRAQQSHHHHHHHHHSSLDDDYLSDTSDISSLGMNGHHGRGGSASKEKKQPEGVDFELLQNDTPAWLRSLRLHKYNSIFEGMPWREIVNLSDGDLVNKGVAALGARRKMLKVFEQVRKEMLLQGMVI
ncbi:hypothetical protein BGX31_010342 [Mortierella sp. GBA43]|nr:hypothetical protein BGX31_010342 [Mortierella sp. GBA43]